MQQVSNIEDIFREYFKNAIVPDRIIELGTATGVFAHLIYKLRKEINNNFDFITIDRLSLIDDLPSNMIFCKMNIYKNIKFIANLIKPRTLFLCDGGNKISEVRLFTPFLKEDCVIMAHDYAKNKSIGNKYWWCCEIEWSDISDLEMLFYFQELMETGGWVSLKK